ncbi:glycosyltransferase family 39 protein [uncultured Clostridium sp.]|uniref:glycosyltransferase family 39 protein n=1 Tax=uncultured Clostridium sp. TaxID=59620 RepID=UPI002619CF01|nr:glycosyltransferase family 39 protein [uncultured Clostridium sp.]
MEKKNKLNIAAILLIIFNAIFLITMCFVLSLGVISPYYTRLIIVSRISVVLVAIVELIVCIGMIYITRKLDKKYLKVISTINFIIFFILLCIFGFLLAVTPTWDFGEVYRTAILKAQDKIHYLPQYYYVLYPNNIFVTMIWTVIYKVFGVLSISYLYGSIGINIILILGTMIITYFLIKDVYGLRIATIASLLFLVITPLYIYAPIFYTDTMTMIFLPLSYLLYRKYLKNNNWLYLISIGILAAIGIGIKNNISIGFIALSIFALFQISGIKKLLKFFAGILIPLVILTGIINGINQAQIPVKLSDAGLPYTHWIMMSLVGAGGWDQQAVDNSLAAGPGKDKIKAYNEKIIKERLDHYGFSGLMEHLYIKNKFTWADGTEYGTFYLKMQPLNKGALYEYVAGDKANGFLTLSQGSELFMLVMIAIGTLGLFKDRKNLAMLCNICIFGIFLFLMIWETCSRYLLCIMPLMLISAMNGISKIDALLGGEKEVKK